jgi:cytochrome b561
MRAAGNSTRGVFDQATRLMHWLTAGLMLSVFVLAFSIDLATSRAFHAALLQLHRSFGLTVWLVTLIRLSWRHFAKYPDWPSQMGRSCDFRRSVARGGARMMSHDRDPLRIANFIRNDAIE